MASEREEALKIATRVLDRCGSGKEDPDTYLAILSRQLVRATDLDPKSVGAMLRESFEQDVGEGIGGMLFSSDRNSKLLGINGLFDLTRIAEILIGKLRMRRS